MSNDYIAPVVARLTWNGAYNLRRTLTDPNQDHPDLINGGHRLSTGLGKWTHIAACGVENNLLATKVAEWREVDFIAGSGIRKALCITPLGREVAEYVKANWDDLSTEFRDFCGKGR